LLGRRTRTRTWTAGRQAGVAEKTIGKKKTNKNKNKNEEESEEQEEQEEQEEH